MVIDDDNARLERISLAACPPSASRLSALYETELMDSEPEERFDRLTRLVAATLAVPVALVSLVDSKRQFFKSTFGLPEPWKTERETPLTHSFCQHVVTQASPLVINNAEDNPLVRDNLAIPDLNVKAYLGVPLVSSDGHVLGSLCAIDSEPRLWSDRDQAILADFGKLVEEQIALREKVEQLAQYDEQRSLIQGELAHRIKNVFSVVTSLLLVSSRTETDLNSFVQNVTGRIQALSRANDYIIGVPSRDGVDPSGLGLLLDELLSPFKRQQDQVLVACTRVAIGPKTAAALALVVHELATNSAKYGALSVADGHIEITGVEDAVRLRLTWREIGGPAIDQMPTKKGFGSKMVARTVESQLRGTIDRHFAPHGLVVTLDLPLAALRA